MLNNQKGVAFVKGLIYFCVALLVVSITLTIGFIVVQGIATLNIKSVIHSSPLIVTTLMVIGLSLLIAVPIGIFSAIYLRLYAKDTKLVRLIRFSIDSLTGVPSIIFGLFALSFFIYYLGFSRSILTGSLTMGIVIMPLIIKNTEEAIKTIDKAQIQGSLALGATMYDTVTKVVVPFCMNGIINGVILGIGRIVGETAALMFVIGTMQGIPTSITQPGATLSTQLYMILQEPTYAEGGINEAYTLALILLIIVVIINLIVKVTNARYRKDK
ncbi:MAG: phosphate ABC transporter permease PstA [Erysipelotrichales bacterium]